MLSQRLDDDISHKQKTEKNIKLSSSKCQRPTHAAVWQKLQTVEQFVVMRFGFVFMPSHSTFNIPRILHTRKIGMEFGVSGLNNCEPTRVAAWRLKLTFFSVVEIDFIGLGFFFLFSVLLCVRRCKRIMRWDSEGFCPPEKFRNLFTNSAPRYRHQFHFPFVEISIKKSSKMKQI